MKKLFIVLVGVLLIFGGVALDRVVIAEKPFQDCEIFCGSYGQGKVGILMDGMGACICDNPSGHQIMCGYEKEMNPTHKVNLTPPPTNTIDWNCQEALKTEE